MGLVVQTVRWICTVAGGCRKQGQGGAQAFVCLCCNGPQRHVHVHSIARALVGHRPKGAINTFWHAPRAARAAQANLKGMWARAASTS